MVPSPARKAKISAMSSLPSSEPMLVEQLIARDEFSSGPVQVWFGDQPEAPRGGSWTRSSGVRHNVGDVSLYSLLVPDFQVPKKYFLSAKACLGILRRAFRRLKTLPTVLEAALRMRVGLGPNDPVPMGGSSVSTPIPTEKTFPDGGTTA